MASKMYNRQPFTGHTTLHKVFINSISDKLWYEDDAWVDMLIFAPFSSYDVKWRSRR